MTYAAWISNYLTKYPCPKGLCAVASTAMAKEFPELRVAKGFVFSAPPPDNWAEDGIVWSVIEQHWWCVAPDGSIVDPTKVQYDFEPIYEEYSTDKHGPMPTGKCYDCGELLFGPLNFCDEVCEAATMRYLESGR